MTTWKEYSSKKILSPENLTKVLHSIRENGETIATINGSFDLLHAGHMHILFEASQCADRLIVAVNSDYSVQLYKNPDRPIIPLSSRMEMLAALGFVDYVIHFDELDPRQILETIRPDVHVNGAEYGLNCIESEVVRKNGGRLHLVERIPGLSTTEVIKKIERLQEKQCV